MSIQLAIESLGAIRTIAGGLVALRDEAKVIELKVTLLQKVFDIQQNLLTLQEENASLLKENRELKDREVEAQKRNEERGGYELFEAAPSVFVVAAKTADGSRPKQPYFCQRCYDAGEKSALGFVAAKDNTERSRLQCPEKAAHCWELPRGYRQSMVASGLQNAGS